MEPCSVACMYNMCNHAYISENIQQIDIYIYWRHVYTFSQINVRIHVHALSGSSTVDAAYVHTCDIQLCTQMYVKAYDIYVHVNTYTLHTRIYICAYVYT